MVGDNPKRWGWGGKGRAEKDMALRDGMRGSPVSTSGQVLGFSGKRLFLIKVHVGGGKQVVEFLPITRMER